MKFKFIILVLIISIFGIFNYNFPTNNESCINISNIENEKSFKGYIKHHSPIKLYFQNEGKIIFMPYKEGDYIRKGQVIARLEGIPYKIKKEKFNLNNEINYNIIASPLNGYIWKIYKPVNSYIKNKEAIVEILSCNKTEAEVLVNTYYINKINLRKNAKIDYKNNSYEAKIANIIKNNDNYIIELEFNDLYKELKEGTSIEARLNLE